MENKTTCIESSALLARKTHESSSYLVAFVYIYAIIAVFSTIANGMVIFTIIFAKELHGTFYKILSSLFVSDFLTGSIIFPLLATLNATFTSPNCTTLVICEFLVHTISFTSILSMMAIAYDRYLRASKRQSYATYMNKTKGRCIILVIWIFSPVAGIFGTLLHSKITAVLAIIIVLAILLLYFMTLRKLKANRTQVAHTICVRTSVSSHDKGIQRSTRLIFVLIVTMLISWCPCISLSLLNGSMLYSSEQYFLTPIQQLPLLSAVTSPVLYFWTNRTTRRCFIAFWRKIRRCSREDETDNVHACTH